MRKIAGILKVLATIALVFEFIAAAGLAVFEAMLAFFDLSTIMEKAPGVITIDGVPMDVTPETINSFKPVLLALIALAFVLIVFTILGTRKIRTVFSECKAEMPFSQESCDALKAAARLVLIGGIVGIAGTAIIHFMSNGVTINGGSVSSSSITADLSFLITAAVLYLMHHVAEYGRSLEEQVSDNQ